MSHYAAIIKSQHIHIVESFELESGEILKSAPVAYKTWGTLNATRDNVMVICHAFTGSADVEDWWGPLMGHGKVFDSDRFFIYCANVLGSPYGSASPVSIDPATDKSYGPEFPATSIRDDVRIHKLVLDTLGVTSVAVVIGGSMGGMAVLEWPLCHPGYVKHVIPIATSARHSAWCISWGEAQRQSIFSDPAYANGYYTTEAPPHSGLGAARMAALLTYRSRDSFESRFGRKPQKPAAATPAALTPPASPLPRAPDLARLAHNDGHRRDTPPPASGSKSTIYSAQSYLRYQGEKFTARFDANCYIHITRKLDTHDVARGRVEDTLDESAALASVLSTIPPRALVIGVQTDGLFMTSEQREIAEHIPEAELIIIQSPDGHDGFLLEFEQINRHVLQFLRKELPQLYATDLPQATEFSVQDFEIKQSSVFGEAEADVTRW